MILVVFMDACGLLQVDCTLKETIRVVAERMGNSQILCAGNFLPS
jgi:hypothetical protein